jgi:hypothetical protein
MSTMDLINIGERAYKYIRQFTIKSVPDALIELITNSMDAYNKSMITPKNIWIFISGNKIIVRDNACGLSSNELQKCFLQVGNYTADQTASRGFFSRGAKDISAIGNLTFDSIKNGIYSQCKLTTDVYGGITIADIPATDVLRNTYGMLGDMSGLQVTIDLLPNFQNSNLSIICRVLQHTAQLRDIMVDSNNFIYCSLLDDPSTTNRLSYTYPNGSLILDLTYNVPSYEQYSARFVIY